jgi:hypothetical protein
VLVENVKTLRANCAMTQMILDNNSKDYKMMAFSFDVDGLANESKDDLAQRFIVVAWYVTPLLWYYYNTKICPRDMKPDLEGIAAHLIAAKHADEALYGRLEEDGESR